MLSIILSACVLVAATVTVHAAGIAAHREESLELLPSRYRAQAILSAKAAWQSVALKTLFVLGASPFKLKRLRLRRSSVSRDSLLGRGALRGLLSPRAA